MQIDCYEDKLMLAPQSEIGQKPKKSDYVNPLNKALRIFFKDAVNVSLRNPAQAAFFLQTVRNQRKAAGVRSAWMKKGLQVPPIAIMSLPTGAI